MPGFLSILLATGSASDTTAPTITSSASVSVVENATLSHALIANESVTWSIVGGADQAQFEISGSTLRWVGNGTKDFESPSDTGADDDYVVTVRATDPASNTTDQTITVTVTNDVTAPTITSSSSVSVAENSTLAHTLTADETSTWSIVGGADQAEFEISGSTLRWVANGVKDFESPSDTDFNDTYIVTVRATDSETNFSDQTITVTVTDVSEVAGSFEYLHSTSALPAASSYTFTGEDFGAADAGRRIVVIVKARAEVSAATLSSATIGGIAADIEALTGDSVVGSYCAVISAKVPTGTSGNVALTFSTTVGAVDIDVISAIGYYMQGAAAWGGTSNTFPTLSVDVAAGGKVIAGVAIFNAPTTISVPALDTLYENNVTISTNLHVSSGEKSIVGATLSYDVDVTLSGGGNDNAVVAAAFSPTAPVGAGGDAWTPARLYGGRIWNRPEELSGSNGAALAQWDDASGYANHSTQPTGGIKPTLATANVNGLNAVRFTAASSQRFILAQVSPEWTAGGTILVVLKGNLPASSINGGPLQTQTDGGLLAMFWTYSDGKFYCASGSNVQRSVTLPVSPDDWRILTIRSRRNSWQADVDGTNIISASGNFVFWNGNPQHMGYGGFTYFDGWIAECFMSRRYETDADLARLQGYAAWKFGLEANLPGGHTYESAAPVLPDDL